MLNSLHTMPLMTALPPATAATLSVNETAGPPFFIAGDLALDFLNSTLGKGLQRVEALTDGAQVLAWLARAGLPHELPQKAPNAAAHSSLHQMALALREHARELVQRCHAGQAGQPDLLNAVLARGRGFTELLWQDGAPQLLARQRTAVAQDLLLPVAQAVAELLAQADFALVRRCEAPDCTLWFMDRTKSHRRRWCSMAVCGNRMKVAAFRARQQGE